MEPAGKGDGAARLAKEQRGSWGDDVDQCPVCFTTFDLALRRPRTLPCGHTFCTVCISRLIEEQGHVPCPTCRKEHPVPESGRFPVCYIMLRKVQDAALASPPARPRKDTTQSGASTPTGPVGGQKGLGKEIQSLLLKQEAKVQTAIIACQEDQAQLVNYQATLTGWVERQQRLEDRLQDVLDQSMNVRALVQHEKSQAGAKKEQARQSEEQLHALLNSLRKATTGEEAFRAINDADIGTDKERERAEEQLGDFPDVRTVSVFTKVREASSAAVDAATTVQAAQETADRTPGAARDSSLQAATASSITDRLEALLAPSLKEREAPTTAVRGTQTEGKEPETHVRGTQTEGKEPEISVRGTQTEGKEPEISVRGTQTEGKEPEASVRGTQTEGKGPETAVRGTQTEGKEPETHVRGTQTDGKEPETHVRGTQTEGKEPETVEYTHTTTAAAAAAAMDYPRLAADPASTIKVEDLRLMTLPVRNLLQTGLVFAHHLLAGQSRYARISVQDGRQYLHCLRDLSLPPRAVTVQMCQVVPAVPPCLVFLDLAWPGSATRRVLVRLSPDTPLARQFVLLCTGQRGPSYAHTRLHGVGNKGQPGELVRGGDYEDNGGSGGAALLPNLDKGDYRRSGRAGDVFPSCWWWLWLTGVPSDRGAQFRIVTRDDNGGNAWPYVFGKVVEGLEDVAAAAQHSPITEVTVVDCGVVLWS